MRPQGHSGKGLSQRASPRRRSASPLKKVHLGRLGSRRAGSVAIRSINYFSERQRQERSHSMVTSSSDSEDNTNSYALEESNSANRSCPASARRVTVQAAINLFERKQSKDVGEVPGKQRSVKQQSRRGSLDGVNPSVSGDFDLRQNQKGKDYAEWHGKDIAKLAEDSNFVSGSFGQKMNSVVRSAALYTEPGIPTMDSKKLSLFQEDGVQLAKQFSEPTTALNFGRGSSVSDDFFWHLS